MMTYSLVALLALAGTAAATSPNPPKVWLSDTEGGRYEGDGWGYAWHSTRSGADWMGLLVEAYRHTYESYYYCGWEGDGDAMQPVGDPASFSDSGRGVRLGAWRNSTRVSAATGASEYDGGDCYWGSGSYRYAGACVEVRYLGPCGYLALASWDRDGLPPDRLYAYVYYGAGWAYASAGPHSLHYGGSQDLPCLVDCYYADTVDP